MTKISIFILSIVSGVFTRAGGSGNYPFWFREAGVSICTIIALWILGFHHWTLIFCFGAMYGAQTTYFKRKGTDAKWFNWALVGLAFGIAVLPIIIIYKNWLGFSIRLGVCAALVPLYQDFISAKLEYAFRKTIGKDILDEFGRGFINIATLPLLLI